VAEGWGTGVAVAGSGLGEGSTVTVGGSGVGSTVTLGGIGDGELGIGVGGGMALVGGGSVAVTTEALSDELAAVVTTGMAAPVSLSCPPQAAMPTNKKRTSPRVKNGFFGTSSPHVQICIHTSTKAALKLYESLPSITDGPGPQAGRRQPDHLTVAFGVQPAARSSLEREVIASWAVAMAQCQVSSGFAPRRGPRAKRHHQLSGSLAQHQLMEYNGSIRSVM